MKIDLIATPEAVFAEQFGSLNANSPSGDYVFKPVSPDGDITHRHSAAVIVTEQTGTGDVMKNHICALGTLALMAGAVPAMAQPVTYAVPYGQTAALPPTAAPARQADPNAPYWMQLEGYNGDGSVSKRWYLVRPQDFDVTNYHGFHTGTQ